MRHLPPLNALRAFEVTARLGGVQRASEELHVTHGAISRHVKQLEGWLGITLFDRSHRSLELNSSGKAYLHSISSALNLIHEGTANLQRYKPPSTLGIVTTHSIATQWLLAKLPDFYRRHPEIEVWLSMEQHLTNFEGNTVDIALRMGTGPWPDLNCTPLMKDRLIPVCSSQLLERGRPLNQPADLSSYTLLHDQAPGSQWSRWFIENNIGSIDCSKGPRFSSSEVLLKAAINGQGVALVNEVLATEDLAQGRLVQPLPQFVDLGNFFWLIMPQDRQFNSNVKCFSKWIKTVV